jgi:hypothetical protein
MISLAIPEDETTSNEAFCPSVRELWGRTSHFSEIGGGTILNIITSLFIER